MSLKEFYIKYSTSIPACIYPINRNATSPLAQLCIKQSEKITIVSAPPPFPPPCINGRGYDILKIG